LKSDRVNHDARIFSHSLFLPAQPARRQCILVPAGPSHGASAACNPIRAALIHPNGPLSRFHDTKTPPTAA